MLILLVFWQVVDNVNGTRSLVKMPDSKLLVTFRSENQVNKFKECLTRIARLFFLCVRIDYGL
jgi:hypothetical protein